MGFTGFLWKFSYCGLVLILRVIEQSFRLKSSTSNSIDSAVELLLIRESVEETSVSSSDSSNSESEVRRDSSSSFSLRCSSSDTSESLSSGFVVWFVAWFVACFVVWFVSVVLLVAGISTSVSLVFGGASEIKSFIWSEQFWISDFDIFIKVWIYLNILYFMCFNNY